MSCKCYVLNAIFSCGPFECSHELSSVDMRLDFRGLVLPVGKALMFCASTYVFLNTLTSRLLLPPEYITDRMALIQRTLTSGLNLNTKYS